METERLTIDSIRATDTGQADLVRGLQVQRIYGRMEL